jgi:adenosylhomocysteine nucleosidase
MDSPVIAKSADAFSAMGNALTLACALNVERRVARKAGARAALVGQGAHLPLPDRQLVSFGFSGGLVDSLRPGMLLTAERVVDPEGNVLWEGEPLSVPGAKTAVICWSPDGVVNEPDARHALAERSGAVAVDMESGALAATGRLVGVVRAVSDTGADPVGALVCAGKADGGTDWGVVTRAFLTEPLKSTRTALDARRALSALRQAAEALG